MPLFPFYKLVWKPIGAPKTSVCALRALNNKLSTFDRAHSTHIGSQTCLLCHSALETRDHLFFTCHYSEYLWTLARLKLGLPPVPIQSIEEEANKISTSFTSKTFGTALARIAFRTVIWAIWKERNYRLHQGQY